MKNTQGILVFKTKTFTAIIPARGGSKRIPHKNTISLNGKPLIAWTIEAALSNKYIDQVIVSSDDEQILAIASTFGAATIKRPNYLSTDTATTFDTLKHALQNSSLSDYTVLLQPTSPLRNTTHIHEAIELLFQKKADAIISVCEAEHHPLWCNSLPEDKNMTNFIDAQLKNIRSQDLPTYYRLNGAIYISKTDRLLAEETFFLSHNSFAYIMDHQSSIDIDQQIDLDFAHYILQKKVQ